jgi:hypothetical protein
LPCDHPDVLHAIERAIVAASRRAPEIEDSTISLVLRGLIRGMSLPTNAEPAAALLFTYVGRARTVPSTTRCGGIRAWRPAR